MDKDNNNINLTKTGIAWESDKKYKFQNPEVPAEGGYTDLADCKIFFILENMSCGNFFASHVNANQFLHTHKHCRKSFFAN